MVTLADGLGFHAALRLLGWYFQKSTKKHYTCSWCPYRWVFSTDDLFYFGSRFWAFTDSAPGGCPSSHRFPAVPWLYLLLVESSVLVHAFWILEYIRAGYSVSKHTLVQWNFGGAIRAIKSRSKSVVRIQFPSMTPSRCSRRNQHAGTTYLSFTLMYPWIRDLKWNPLACQGSAALTRNPSGNWSMWNKSRRKFREFVSSDPCQTVRSN
jgi:hypothetical protein